MGQCCSHEGPITGFTGASHEEMLKNFGDLSEDAAMAAVVARLAQITEEHPYLKPTGTEPTPHQLLYFVRRCREYIIMRNSQEALSCIERIQRSLKYEIAQIRDAFRRFDHDGSNYLDQNEYKYLCAYLGWGEEEARLMDLDADQKVTFEEFQLFVGHMGGLAQLFEHRRQRVASKNWGEDAPAVVEVGARIRAFYYTQDGKKSSTWREAQVLELNVMPENGVRLLFGFGEESDGKAERQVVPPSWIFYDSRDSEVVAALREVGILEEQQAFWASIFPQSEMRAVASLVPCQHKALAHVRANAAMNHEKALPEVRERFAELGYGEEQLQAVLGWIQDLAPMCIHVHIDNVGRFLETDEFYRNQFETGTSCGALDDGNIIRKGWEKELFGGCYDDSKPFERCKYGALSVMNDYRGVLSAYQYGDSYLVLKDVRLRTTFAATDSGGIAGSRLAVLDKYAHVLQEYDDRELRELVEVALANTSLTDVGVSQPRLLRGMSSDCAAEWITVGFPDLPQKKGRYYFEVELLRGCRSAQVGFLSNQFIIAPKTVGYNGGVGDDDYGWGVDGQHALRWHGGNKLPWDRYWSVSQNDPMELEKDITVGVAIDIDSRMIWFASNGEWDAEKSPSFGPETIPKGQMLYPAVSLKGRASFNFGPEFKHPAPKFKGFAAWPGMPDGKVRADVPIIGDENNVGIYKEIQIHGEVSLKKNVQRLVANRKYLDRTKDSRSWAVIIDGLGVAEGTYGRTGAEKGTSVFSQRGGDHLLLCDTAKKIWKVVHKDKHDEILAWSAMEEGRTMDPPRSGWEVPYESRGSVTQDIFKKAMKEIGLSDGECKALISALGKNSKVYRHQEKTNFVKEWAKVNNGKTADEACHRELQGVHLNSFMDIFPELTGCAQKMGAGISSLLDRYQEVAEERKRLHNLVLELKGNIRVFVRVRPMGEKEKAAETAGEVTITFAEDCKVSVYDANQQRRKWFEFDKAFQPKCSQQEVFEEVKPLATSVLDGYNVCIFAYGQTGSGKTFTMTGTEANPGLNTRVLRELFQIREQRKEEVDITISLSVTEIYNEMIKDLFNPDSAKTKKLDVKQNSDGTNSVPGLTERPVKSVEEVLEYMKEAQANRTVMATDMNDESSRSHSIVQVKTVNVNRKDQTQYLGKINLIDLAGSENVNKSGVQGQGMREAQNINKSLLALGDVVAALQSKNGHVPFRNSKLTMMLKDSLGGDSKTLMIVQCSPAQLNVTETTSSLTFASKARNVELGKAKRNVKAGEA